MSEVLRSGDPSAWIQTFSGRAFYPLDPRSEDIVIEDIAHALSQQCRFSGHSLAFYSVAEHSVRASYLVPDEDRFWALMHDSSEAYLTDVSRPIKPHLVGYKEIERAVMKVICEHFKMPLEQPGSVHWADEIMLATEARDLMAEPPQGWNLREAPNIQKISPWNSGLAEHRFLQRFTELGGK